MINTVFTQEVCLSRALERSYESANNHQMIFRYCSFVHKWRQHDDVDDLEEGCSFIWRARRRTGWKARQMTPWSAGIASFWVQDAGLDERKVKGLLGVILSRARCRTWWKKRHRIPSRARDLYLLSQQYSQTTLIVRDPFRHCITCWSE